jgi:hypothetical protein
LLVSIGRQPTSFSRGYVSSTTGGRKSRSWSGWSSACWEWPRRRI